MDRLNTTNSQIAHFVLDEKFVDMALREFDAVAPGRNLPIILGKPRPLKYVKCKNVSFMTVGSAIKYVNSDKCASVIFHSLPELFLPILKYVSSLKPKIWIGWGSDYYDRLLRKAFPKGFLLYQTLNILHSRPKPGIFQKVVNKANATMRHLFGVSVQCELELLSRIDWFIPVIDREYKMACDLNPGFSPRYVTWNYGTVEDDLGGIEADSSGTAEDILIGNSASPTSNHIETFLYVKKNYDIMGRKILVPLNYGDQWYGGQVLREGEKILGQAFHPILGFLPQDKYIKLLSSCGHVFFNHLRQQALGNICIMMLKGAKIYLNQANPLFQWFIERGAQISPILSNATGHYKPLTPLTDFQKETNRNLVLEHWGRSAQRQKTQRIVEIALASRES